MKQITTEAVTAGHPDKVCDQIADAILTAHLKLDPKAHVACEVMCSGQWIWISGEISSEASRILNNDQIAYRTLKDIGYNPEIFDIRDVIRSQSPEINEAVSKKDNEEDQGAGDQGIMFGYACNETPEFLPKGVVCAQKLAKAITDNTGYGPDGKTQVTMTYHKNSNSPEVSKILVSVQHPELFGISKIEKNMKDIIFQVIPEAAQAEIIINPSGSFVKGGPEADTGLTGRKLAVDTYGGYARFGGGALCGKDPSKVDRSGAYMARYLAKTVCDSLVYIYSKEDLIKSLHDTIFGNESIVPLIEVEVQLSYAIGKADPMSVNITATINGHSNTDLNDALSSIVTKEFSCKPHDIISQFDLTNFDYTKVSSSCQFLGDYPWEVIDESSVYKIVRDLVSEFVSKQQAEEDLL